VYVVGADATAAVRPVEVSLTQGDVAIVSGGVQASEPVVIDGQNELKPGAKVVAREAGAPYGSGKGDAASARAGQGGTGTVAEPDP